MGEAYIIFQACLNLPFLYDLLYILTMSKRLKKLRTDPAFKDERKQLLDFIHSKEGNEWIVSERKESVSGTTNGFGKIKNFL